MAEMKLTIGCDPELQVLQTKKRKDTYVPAWELTKGTKEAPVEISKHNTMAKGLKVQADGVALEFNIDPVDLSSLKGVHTFSREIRRALDSLRLEFNANFAFDPVCSNYLEEDLMHPLALAHGCDPDFDAYSENPSAPRIVDFSKLNPKIKMFGGHVHLGYNQELAPPHVVARLMDIFHGCWTGSDFRSKNQRTEVYGRPGIFRPKPYGVEYRTPSPRWLREDGAYYVGEAAFNAVFFLTHFRPEVVDVYKKTDWDEVQVALNSCDGNMQARVYEKTIKSLEKATGIKWQKVSELRNAPQELDGRGEDDEDDDGGNNADVEHDRDIEVIEDELLLDADELHNPEPAVPAPPPRPWIPQAIQVDRIIVPENGFVQFGVHVDGVGGNNFANVMGDVRGVIEE